MEPAADNPQETTVETTPLHPAREMTMHLLRMLETRIEAAGLTLQAESQRILKRIQLKVVAGAAIFFAVWAGIVLLAIALPEDARVPVLAGVVGAFVLLAIGALLWARSLAARHVPGSLSWFLDSLKSDLEVVARSLQQPREAAPEPAPEPERSPPRDIAA